VNLTAHFHVLLRLKNGGAVPSKHLMSSVEKLRGFLKEWLRILFL
jgi:hypothetical protein